MTKDDEAYSQSCANRRVCVLLAVSLIVLGACLIIPQFIGDDASAVRSYIDGTPFCGEGSPVYAHDPDSGCTGLMTKVDSSGAKGVVFDVDGIIYEVSGRNVLTVMGFAGYPVSELVIPSKIASPDGLEYTVVKIAKDAFKGMIPVESAVIPDTVTEMGKNAFEGCSSLKSLTVPISVKCPHGSKDHAFKGVSLTRLVLTKGTDGLQRKDNDFWKPWRGILEELVVDEGVRSITASFKDWDELVSVTLKDVESILEDQFRRCDRLVTVTAPSVRTVHDNAFMDCPRLNTVDIPSFESHTRGIFVRCPSLKTIVSEKLFIDNGQLFLILDDGNLSLIQQLDADVETVEIPFEVAPPSGGNRTVTEIGKEAFREQRNLDTLLIPDCVVKVDEHAFHDCKSLKNISIPIGIDCSYNTKKTAFEGVKPTTLLLTAKGYDADRYMDNEFWKPWRGSLKGLILYEGITDFKTSFKGKKLTCISALGIGSVHGDQFRDCDRLSTVSLPEAVDVGKSAFKGCDELMSVDMPKVTDIGREAFASCESLFDFSGDSVRRIDEKGFYRCISLRDFDFDNVERVRSKAFCDTCVEGAPEHLKHRFAKDAFASSGYIEEKKMTNEVKAILASLVLGTGIPALCTAVYNFFAAIGATTTVAELNYGLEILASQISSIDAYMTSLGNIDLASMAEWSQVVATERSACSNSLLLLTNEKTALEAELNALTPTSTYVARVVISLVVVAVVVALVVWTIKHHSSDG